MNSHEMKSSEENQRPKEMKINSLNWESRRTSQVQSMHIIRLAKWKEMITSSGKRSIVCEEIERMKIAQCSYLLWTISSSQTLTHTRWHSCRLARNVLPIVNWNAFIRVLACLLVCLPQPLFPTLCLFSSLYSIWFNRTIAGAYFLLLLSFSHSFRGCVCFSLLVRHFFSAAKYCFILFASFICDCVCKFASSLEIYGRSTKSMCTRSLSTSALLFVLWCLYYFFFTIKSTSISNSQR